MKTFFSIMSNLQTHSHFKLDFQKWTNIQWASGESTAPNTTRTISCKAWNPNVEYPSRESKHDTKESEVNMFNPKYKENIQRQKHPGRWVVTEPELPSFGKPKCVVQN